MRSLTNRSEGSALSYGAGRYAVHSIFLTIQGEGAHSGRRAVFVRFSGCNVWSGREQDRKRDAQRNAPCAQFCDTEFFGFNPNKLGRIYDREDLVNIIAQLWGTPNPLYAGQPLVVCTGGEPSMQLDSELVLALRAKLDAYVAVETNGSAHLPVEVDWITLSPKPPMPVVHQLYKEVKVLYPAFDPHPYASLSARRWVQPVDPRADGGTAADWLKNMAKCVQFVMANPSWRLGQQLHKIAGVE